MTQHKDMKYNSRLKAMGLCGLILVMASGCLTSKQLFSAAKQGDGKEIQRITKRGANVNVLTNHGSTPLHFAISESAVDALVSGGALINIRNQAGDTPLHVAIKNRRESAIKALIRNGAQVNIENNDGNTPLHLAVMGKLRVNVVEWLLNAGADMNSLSGRNVTALDIAYNDGDARVLSLMFQRNLATYKGRTSTSIIKDWGQPSAKESVDQGGSRWVYERAITIRRAGHISFRAFGTENAVNGGATFDGPQANVRKTSWSFLLDAKGNCSEVEWVRIE